MPENLHILRKCYIFVLEIKNEHNDFMKWKELIRIAIEKGYRLQSHGKKHDIYVNDQGDRLIVERHGSQEIRKGLQSSLKKQLGI